MKLSAIILFVFTVINISVYGQNGKLLSVEQQISDVNELENKLKIIHPSLYRFCSPIEFDSTLNSIKNEINQPNTEEVFFELLSPIFFLIKDAHTWKQLSKSEQLNKLMPFDFKISNNQLFVYNNCSYNNELTPGTRILKIGNENSEDIIKRLKANVVTDGFIETTKERVVEEWFKYILKPQNYYFITYQYKSKTKTIEVESLTDNIIDSIRKNRIENKIQFKPQSFNEGPFTKLSINSKDNYGIIKIKWFDKIPFVDYKNFLDKSVQELNTNRIANLIIDLRWNIGGPREYPIYLLSKILNQSFQYCDSLITTKYTLEEKNAFDTAKVFLPMDNGLYKVVENARGLGMQNPSNETFNGNIYILIDGQSNSSSAQFASIIYQNQRGIIIGEEAGGLFDGGTGEYHYYLTLKNSKIKVQIPRYRIVLHVDKSKFYGHGVKPDYTVKDKIDDLINGKDTVMDFTIELLKK
jgi:C-terminal processing protease CtpA/Prc